jgi:hypothetical protein
VAWLEYTPFYVYLLWEVFRSKNFWEIKEQVTSPKKNLSA